MRLYDFYKFILLEYMALWIPFVVGLGFLINFERGRGNERKV